MGVVKKMFVKKGPLGMHLGKMASQGPNHTGILRHGHLGGPDHSVPVLMAIIPFRRSQYSTPDQR